MSALTLPTILCCMCGIDIQSNPTNMCNSCLHDNVDITSEINKKLTIHSCRTCGRFLGPPWQELQLESKELMIVCLRKIHGLHKGVKLIDAAWVWTEPHSMRLKIKLVVQKEIMNNAVVQQSTICEFTIRNQQCKHCEASFATGAWHAIVQVRQRVHHKRTFYYLEQLILKHHAHKECIKIVTFKDGIDFYFKDKNQGLRFIDFLNDAVPMRSKYSRKLVSADQQSNTADFKHNYLIEVAPICKDDLLLLPKDLAAKQSNISPLVLVKRIGSSIFVVDPTTGERTDINSDKYWRYNFLSILSSKQLIRYTVLSVEPILSDYRPSARMKRVAADKDEVPKGRQAVAASSKLAECTIARERDFGMNDIQFTVMSHLGPILSVGDVVLGYDLTSTNFNIDEDGEKLLSTLPEMPDVIIVRKCYDKERLFELKNLKAEVETEGKINNKKGEQDNEEDLEHFMQQVQGDREMRQHINVYKKKELLKKKAEADQMDEDDEDGEYDDEEVRLEELLDDMSLHSDLEDGDDDDEEEEGEEGAPQKEIKLLSPSDAAKVTPAFELSPSSGNDFDASAFDPKKFKFV